MLTMNRATLLGFAGKHPEMRKLPSGDDVAQFSLATTERFRRKDDTVGEATQWHTIVAYGAAAEVVRTRVRKGDPVLVEGRIATRSWEDKAGNERRAIEIVVAGRSGTVNVLTKRKAGGNGGDEDPPGGAAAAGGGTAAGENGADAEAVAERAAASPAQEGGEAGDPQGAAEPAADAGEAASTAGEAGGAAGTGSGSGDGTPAPSREADGQAEPGDAASAAAPRHPAPSGDDTPGHE